MSVTREPESLQVLARKIITQNARPEFILFLPTLRLPKIIERYIENWFIIDRISCEEKFSIDEITFDRSDA